METTEEIDARSEQRKLRSRDAARCRRSQEMEVFYELACTLPLPRRVSTHLDKAGIMRVTLSFLRMQHLLQTAAEIQKEELEKEKEDPMDTFYPQALAGFILVMTEEGDMIYLTESVSGHIGITQLELLGQSVYDFVHPCDQEELRELLAPHPGSSKKSQKEQQRERNFFLRMKSTLTSRGRTVNIKSATWKVLHCTGHMGPFLDSFTSPPVGRVMTLLCEPVPHPSSVGFPLDTCTFLTRHSMDLRFTHCEGRVTELVGYKPNDLIGRSAYEFHHALDSKHVIKSLHTLLSKGQVSTSIYRFLANSGGFVWAETQATILYSSKTSQPEAIICLNFILSAVEQPDVVFSIEQIRLQKSEPQSPTLPPVYHGISAVCDSDSELLTSLLKSKPCQTKDAGLSPSSPNELIQVPCEAGDPDVLPLGEFVELSFVSRPSPKSLPDHPQDLCTPQLRQLLMPIFSPVTPPSASSCHSELSPCEDEDEELMDANKVEKFFAIRSDGQSKDETLEMLEGMDLDMLAPYISMDDDFQLTFLSSLLEKADKPSFLPESSLVSRKRSHNLSGDEFSQLMVQDKRQKQDPFSVEEELLLSHRLLDNLDETNQSDLISDPGSGGRSQLLTDRPPVLKGLQGICDSAAVTKDVFIHCPYLLPPISPLT